MGRRRRRGGHQQGKEDGVGEVGEEDGEKKENGGGKVEGGVLGEEEMWGGVFACAGLQPWLSDEDAPVDASLFDRSNKIAPVRIE